MKPSSRRAYLNYTTSWGVDLTRIAKVAGSTFLVHECGYVEGLENWNHPGVDSPFWRFYHNPKAGCRVRFGEREVALGPGNCVLIPGDTVFDCVGPVKMTHFWIHFTLARSAMGALREPVVLTMKDEMPALISAAIATHRLPAGQAREVRLHHQSLAVLHAAFARLDHSSLRQIPEALVEVIDLIHRAPHSDLSNKVLSARAGLPLERFIRLFREHTGQTPAAYVIAVRVRASQEALALTDRSIEQIAFDCGFPNRHYFTRMFSRALGCGPAEFRLRQWQRIGI